MVKVAERMPRSGGVGVALGYSSTLYSVRRDVLDDTRRDPTTPEIRHSPEKAPTGCH